MHSSSTSAAITIQIPERDHRLYRAAGRLLKRIMGPKAPSVDVLILTQVVGRDVTGLVDGYLDGVGWPSAAGRMVSLRRDRGIREVRLVAAPQAGRPVRVSSDGRGGSCRN
jgi:hypothetical protein